VGDKEASGISRLLGAVKLQSAPDVDNPRYRPTPLLQNASAENFIV